MTLEMSRMDGASIAPSPFCRDQHAVRVTARDQSVTPITAAPSLHKARNTLRALLADTADLLAKLTYATKDDSVAAVAQREAIEEILG